jgi:prepilin-type N-terminal cleavage/methylation domain-containing protein
MPIVASRGRGGFTLVELAFAVAIAGVLAAAALAAYPGFMARGRAAQALSNIDHIGTVTRIEASSPDLQAGATAGKAPPRLNGLLRDDEFNGDGGLTLWLIRAPAGTFASISDRDVYALVAKVPAAASSAILALRRSLPYGDGDMPWLDNASFVFPLELVAGAGAAPPKGGACASGSSWSASPAQSSGGTWKACASVTACGSDAKPLDGINAGAWASMTFTVRAYDGTVFTRGWDDTRQLSGGNASFCTPDLSMGAGETVLSVRFTLERIAYYYPTDPPIKWDGTASSVVVSKP